MLTFGTATTTRVNVKPFCLVSFFFIHMCMTLFQQDFGKSVTGSYSMGEKINSLVHIVFIYLWQAMEDRSELGS